MTFNNTRYGILTNWERALFLRRTKVDGRHTLDVYSVELDGDQHISMLKAWVGMVLLAEADWFTQPLPSLLLLQIEPLEPQLLPRRA